MKSVLFCALFSVLLAFALPLLLSVPGTSAATPVESDLPTAPLDSAGTAAPADSPAPVLDDAITLRLWTEDGVKTISMAEYLPLAVAGEMPAAFHPEALKAQTVALRSYALYYRDAPKSAHPEADVCESAGCCAARATLPALRETWGERFDEYYAKICAAVAETDGQYLVWEDAPALTVFHASSAGRTESGAALGVPQAYLLSVDTPETEDSVRNLASTVEVSAEEFRRAILSLAPTAELSGPPETWLGPVSADTAGRVEAMEIGGQRFSGLTLRQLFSLRSTDFTLERREADFVFHVRGYGHGLGMSQYGADLLADGGANYGEILEHYYPGTRLVIALR